MTFRTQMSVGQLRLMMMSDLEDAGRLSAGAGWNQTLEDWRLLLRLSPHGCFAIELDGAVVATTTVVVYRQELAWIGMVLTHPEYRGRGFARRLLAKALEYAELLGIATIKLDATEQGRPLYEKFGFIAEKPIERWNRAGVPTAPSVRSGFSLNGSLIDLDRQAFGIDRSALLQALCGHSTVESVSGGFVFRRRGRIAQYLGPCVASNPGLARRLIIDAVSGSANTAWYWDLIPQNESAVAVATELGFTLQRGLTRMARGRPLFGSENMIYAVAGFELG